jgi:hypothetical protein
MAVLSGCATPSIGITSKQPTAPPAEDAGATQPPGLGVALTAFDTVAPAPKPKEVIFRMRTSHLVLGSTGKAPSDSGATTGATTNVCPPAATPPGGGPAVPPAPADCLAAATVTSTASAAGSTYYIAAPKDSLPWVHTSLSTTTSGDDPSNITALNVSVTDNSAKMITGAGTGATSGAAFGPWGIAGGAILGAIGGMRAEGGPPAIPVAILCTKDQANFNPPNSPELQLPASIDTTPALPASGQPVLNPLQDGDTTIAAAVATAGTRCWHQLPYVGKNPGATSASGWLYRLSVIRRPTGLMHMADYMASKSASTQFPYNACELAELDLVWWGSIKNQGWTTASQVAPDKSFFVRVTVLDDLQTMTLPQSGAIKLGPICGATLAATPYTGASASDELSALASFAEAIEKLETPAKK